MISATSHDPSNSPALELLHELESRAPDLPGGQARTAGASPHPSNGTAVLSISPFPEDHSFLQPVFDPAGWRFYAASTYREGMTMLSRYWISVVICECKLPDGDWKDILGRLESIADPPRLIVTSRLADAYLWAEVLNLGGYDVLAKPFCYEEVLRVTALAIIDSEREARRNHAESVPNKAVRTEANGRAGAASDDFRGVQVVRRRRCGDEEDERERDDEVEEEERVRWRFATSGNAGR